MPDVRQPQSIVEYDQLLLGGVSGLPLSPVNLLENVHIQGLLSD